MTIRSQAAGGADQKINGVLRSLHYLCTGASDHLEKGYNAFLLDDVLYDILSGSLGQILRLPAHVVELEGMAIEQFSFQAICSISYYDNRNFFVDIAPMLERRVIVASQDFSLAIFSDFNDFQIALIDHDLLESNKKIAQLMTSLRVDLTDYSEFEKGMNNALQAIARRIEGINSSLDK